MYYTQRFIKQKEELEKDIDKTITEMADLYSIDKPEWVKELILKQLHNLRKVSMINGELNYKIKKFQETHEHKD